VPGITAWNRTDPGMSHLGEKAPRTTTWVRGTIELSFVTDVGLVRPSNQDSLFVADSSRTEDPLGLLVAVADGMGGHQGGEIASSHVTKALEGYYETVKRESIEKEFKRLLTDANRSLYRASRQDPDLTGMGTTLTAAIVRDGRSVTVFHVGDSRAYLWRSGELTQISQDHSFVAEELKKGSLTPEEAAVHPKRHIITRAFGTRPFLDVDTYNLRLEYGDDLLLCTDGLHGGVSDEAIRDVFKRCSPAEQTVVELLDLAHQAGGHDNIAIVLIRSIQRASWIERLRDRFFRAVCHR